MSFSNLVSDIAYRDRDRDGLTNNDGPRSVMSRGSRTASYARSVASTATSVSISGDIRSQLHGGYGHVLTRAWQAERQLTKVCSRCDLSCDVYLFLVSLRYRAILRVLLL